MRFGPTSLQLTSVLAKGLHRPKLRPDLMASEQVLAGERSVVVKIPETGTFARYGDFEFSLLKLCDGTRTPAEIAAAMAELHPDSPVDEEEVLEFLDGVEPNLWERSLGEKNLAILERIRQERKSRADTSSLLYMTFAAWDPNKTLERIHPYLRWMYTAGFVLVSLLLFATTAAIVVGDYARIRQDTVAFYSFTNKTSYDLWIFWVLLFVISGIHEFGHGLTCKHFGGDVHQMGLMLIYFTPAFYTDCTEICMFDRTSKRLWTIFAGIWVELFACGIATLVWHLAPPGSFVGDLGYKTLLLTGVSGVFINLNPLMKFDGYYALSQALGLESLREDSFEYLKTWFRRTLLRQDLDLPPAPRRKRRIYLAYSIPALIYGVVLLVTVAIFLRNVSINRFGPFWGYTATTVLLYFILRKRLAGALPALRAGLRGAKEKFMAWRMTRGQQWGALAIVLLLFVPTPTTVTTDFILEPAVRDEVRTPVPGWVAEVPVREGQPVAAGAVLAVLQNPEIEARASTAQAQLDLAERSLLDAESRHNSEGIARWSQENARRAAALADARAKQAGLVLRAPHAGVVTTPEVQQRVGEYLTEGETFAVVADRSEMRARVLVRDWELEEVHVGAPVSFKVRTYPLRTFSGIAEQILPAAALDRPVSQTENLERKGQQTTNYIAVVLRFPNPDGALLEGMTGIAKIYGHRLPILWHAGRASWRWFRSQVW